MLFPLDIISGICERNNIAVLKPPKHPDMLFEWVSALPDDATGAVNLSGPTIYVVEHASQAPIDALCIVTKPDADDERLAAPDSIHVSTTLPCAMLADHIQRRLISIIQWNDEMAQMLDDGCVSQDLLKASEPVLESYIGLSDSTFSHIAHTPNIMPLDEASRSFVEHGYYDRHAIERFRREGLTRRSAFQDLTVVKNDPDEPGVFPYAYRIIKQHGRYAAQLLMTSPSRITSQHVFLFNLLAKKVEACLAHYWRLENPLEQKYTYLLKEILNGNTYDEGHLAERVRMHGLKMEGTFELCLIENVWRSVPTEYFAKVALSEIAESKVAINGEQIAILLSLDMGQEERLPELERTLGDIARENEIEVGISERFTSLPKAAFALEEARIALRYGHRHSRRYLAFDKPDGNTETLLRFRRYFPYFACDPFAHSEQFIAKLLSNDNVLATLRARDRERGTNDYEILRLYLRNEGRINTICNTMHMHRNTVTYRLEKIRACIGEDIDDGDIRMYLRILYLLSE